jgi:hypothetical protein
MKSLIFATWLLFFSPLCLAMVPTNCNPENAEVSQRASVVEAFILLEKVHFLAPLNLLNDGQYEEFSSALGKLGPSVGSLELRELCDFSPQQAALDPALSQKKGALKQTQIKLTYSEPLTNSPAKFFDNGKNSVAISREVELKGRVIRGECKDVLNCTSVYQFYVDSVTIRVLRGYSTGGFSSAGGQ